VVFNGLIQNSDFKNKFLNKFADFSNTRFYPDMVISKIQRIKENIETEMPRHFTKWGNNLADWNSNIDVLKNFAQNRIPYMQQQFISQFNLGGLVNLAIGTNLNEGVKVKLNNIEINNFPWDGEYFLNTSVELEAVSKTGIKFVEWVINGNVKISDRETTLTLTDTTISIEAIFEDDLLND
ncbi:MAG: CotH kinase family protein, partial [Ignavibacteriae bacterium]|nr:CotH kinase family protein [Ignavibacteriota bacterium]